MSYQPAHAPSLTKHNNQLFEFDSPATIAKQQEHQQLRPMQAGGAPPGFSSAPAPPALPQLAHKPSRSMRLKTRDWSNQPWKTNSTLTDSYRPPSSLTSSNLPSSQKWGDHTISNTISSTPRTPNLLGVYDPTLLSGQTTHLQHHDHKTHSIPQASQYSSGSNLPLATSALPLATSALPVASGLSPLPSSSALHSSGLPTSNYVPSSTIPISHDYHLPSSNLAHSTGPISGPALSKASTPSSSFGSSGIPSAPAWTGYKWGSWRSQNRGARRSLRPLRTRNWGVRSNNGWSGYNNQNTISESFLRNRPQFVNAPTAPRLPSSSLFAQRKWKSGPYRQRNIRTRNWGFRNGDGWANFNRGLYSNEAALPFNVNRQRFAQDSDIQRSAPISAPIQSNWNNAPIQQQSFAPVMAAPVMAAPIAAAPLPLAAPLKGRKARRAAKKQAKQQAIQNKLLTELNAPIGDPAVNHYRRGAKATVPIAGPAIAGLAAPTGSIGSRRTGRKNNLGRRRNRLAGPTLPVTAASVAPLGYAAPISAAPISAAPLGYPMATAAPISAASVPFIPQQQQRSFVQPQLAQSALPLQSNRHLYSSSEQQVRPLSTNFGQQVMPSNQPLYSAGEPVAAQLMQKQQPTLNAQGIPTTSSIY